MLLEFQRGHQKDVGQRLLHIAERHGDDDEADQRQHGRVDIGRKPCLRRSRQPVTHGEGDKERDAQKRAHQPAFGIQRHEGGFQPAVLPFDEPRHGERDGKAEEGDDDRVVELDRPAAIHQAVDGIDERIDRSTHQQRAVEAEHHRLQVPETHGETLHQPAARPWRCGGGDQPRDQQRQHRHESVGQRIDTIENHREGAGEQARADTEERQENRDGNGEFQQGLFCHDVYFSFKTGRHLHRGFSPFFESRKRSNSLFCRISGRKTGVHFSWKCSINST
ncbi:hypothetical protein D3C80_1260500 [compost metagenome]